MSLISVNNLTFGYDGNPDNVFDGVCFSFDTNWRTGLIGRNGRGKTTLVSLLLGKHEYSGEIASVCGFCSFPFPVENISEMTSDILGGIAHASEDWEIIREISLLGVEPEVLYRPFESLSHGERAKCLLAALFLTADSDGKYLIIDEPTNHLDADGRRILADYLAGKSGFLLVSHDRSLLDACCDRILSINRSTVTVTSGGYSTWAENKSRRDDFERDENKRLSADVKRLREAAKQTSQWSDKVEATKIGGHTFDRGAVGAQAARVMKRSKAAEKRQLRAADEKSALLRDIDEAEPLKIFPLKFHSERIFSAKDLSLFYGEKKVCGPLSFEFRQGDRAAVIGKNGAGKSTLIKLLAGIEGGYRCEGEFYRAAGLKISYVNQDTSRLFGSLSDYADNRAIDVPLFLAILDKLGVERKQFGKDISGFSEGQKKKVLIAASLSERANVYIWDEPLNFIDLLSRVQIENLLAANSPTMLFVEHDALFREKISSNEIRVTNE